LSVKVPAAKVNAPIETPSKKRFMAEIAAVLGVEKMQ
jgi:hypothetical protein